MRMSRHERLVIGLLATALSALPWPVLASWQPGGVTVLNSSAMLSPLVACNDGGFGSFVVWQESSSGTSGVVRAQHLIATGDLDSAWPAGGASVCDVPATRDALGVLPDHLGGCWVWWTEGGSLYVNRLDASGSTGAGWPECGRSIGTVFVLSPTPSVIEDGAHGLYVAWVDYIDVTHTAPVYGAHLAPDYAGSGDWPNGVRVLALPSANHVRLPLYPQLALAPDGGVFLAWGEWALDAPSLSTFRVRRYTAAGLDAPGWTADGLSLGTFHGDFMEAGLPPSNGSVALAPDDRGGVFLFAQSVYNRQAYPFTRLYRRQGDGSGAADWPAAGAVVNWIQYGNDAEPSGSVRVILDGLDGAIAGAQTYFTEFPMTMGYMQYRPNGTARFSSPLDHVVRRGHEVAPAGGGRVFFASFWPSGPTYGWYDPPAFIAVDQMNAPAGWVGLYEAHYEHSLTWYGDIALAPSGDGGAVLFWSQVRERFGLFARRFAPSGEVTEVTGVSPTGSSFALRGLRFVPGVGVRARVALPGDTPARLELFDLAGRRVALLRLDATTAGEIDLTMPGTSDLASGIYFARLDSPKGSLRGRVAVLH